MVLKLFLLVEVEFLELLMIKIEFFVVKLLFLMVFEFLLFLE